MLSYWMLSNFKSVRDRQELDLRPVTLVAGTNSSGKSTVLQSILLISQTLQSRFKQQHLLPNGEMVNLGGAADVLNFENPNQPFMLGGELQFLGTKSPRQTGHFFFQLMFDTLLIDESLSTFELSAAHYERIQTNNEKTTLTITRQGQFKPHHHIYDVTEAFPENIIPTSEGIRVSQFLPTTYLFEKSAAAEFREEINQLTGLVSTVAYREELLDVETNNSLGEEMRELLALIAQQNYEANHWPDEWAKWVTAMTRTDDLLTFAREMAQNDFPQYELFIQDLSNEAYRHEIEKRNDNKKRKIIRALPAQVRRGLNDMAEYFRERVHYLGPLRDDPRVIYAIPNNLEFRHVGLKGEYTAAMLSQYGDEWVDYPIPNTQKDHVRPRLGRATLKQAVGEWLVHMGLATDVKVDEMTNIGYQLSIQQGNTGQELALTRVGVGVSQILPTLVMCLLVEPPCTLLIEQPELHLHPRVQSILGDFFLGLSVCNKQVIVETHSEHIINRLFLRIAQDGLKENPNNTPPVRHDIGIIFVEKENNVSQFRLVEPNEFGVIPADQWPKGFIDQSALEIQEKLDAIKQRRRSQRQKPQKESQEPPKRSRFDVLNRPKSS